MAPVTRSRAPTLDTSSQPGKRQRTDQSLRITPVASICEQSQSENDEIEYYGLGDDMALDNLFASYPRRFTTVPYPYEARRTEESLWIPRPNSYIYLENHYYPGKQLLQRVQIPIPMPQPNHSVGSSDSGDEIVLDSRNSSFGLPVQPGFATSIYFNRMSMYVNGERHGAIVHSILMMHLSFPNCQSQQLYYQLQNCRMQRR
ncbi:hypothetical protein F4861DRAFT_491348 [Xylaria intraflava]|nr:hypothetical protein F4861DRAFT_491348 [Xylaria intraflava]